LINKTTTVTAPPGIVTLSMICLLASGCASAPTEQQSQRLAWPAPPATARIEFVRTISSEQDLGADTTFSQKVINIIGGQSAPPRHVVQPMGLAVSDDGDRVYVSNLQARAVFVFDFTEQSFIEIEQLARPVGLALDAEEHLYVAEQARQRIAVFDTDGQLVRSITHADIERPNGIAIDRDRGRIYLVNTSTGRRISETGKNHSILVFDLDGTLLDTITSTPGEQDSLAYPTYVTLDQTGNIYVGDTMNARVVKYDADGNYLTSFGKRGNGYGMFERPKGVALDSFGNLYVVDSAWSNVQIFNPRGDVLLYFGARGSIPGLLLNPTAIAIDQQNRIYVADHLNHRVNIYQLVNTHAEDSFPETSGSTENDDVTGL
jgi:DNA-binding beta-propeller fold protein YncE